jgi:hypothetical protein
MKIQERHVRIYILSEKIMYLLFRYFNGKTIRWCVIEGPPENARFLAANIDWHSQCLKLLFEHESFELVEPGQEPPQYEITIAATDDINSGNDFIEQVRKKLDYNRYKYTPINQQFNPWIHPIGGGTSAVPTIYDTSTGGNITWTTSFTTEAKNLLNQILTSGVVTGC